MKTFEYIPSSVRNWKVKCGDIDMEVREDRTSIKMLLLKIYGLELEFDPPNLRTVCYAAYSCHPSAKRTGSRASYKPGY